LIRVELRKAAAELGVNEFTLQMVVVSKGIPISEAVKIIKASIEAGKATAAETN
jgi:D-ribose pyranose/furanose isomerase RbsD